MKHYVVLLIAFIAVISCSCAKRIIYVPAPQSETQTKSKNPFDGGAYDLPCEMYDDENYFAATGIASGPANRKGSIQKAALANAQDIIRQKAAHAFEGMITTYFESIGSNNSTDIDDKVEGGIDQIIMGVLNETEHSCLKFSPVGDDGNIECYIGVKVQKSKLVDKVADNLSKNKKDEIRKRSEDFRKKTQEKIKEFKE